MTIANDSAFPIVKSESSDPVEENISKVWSEGGLTKREYFAARMAEALLPMFMKANEVDFKGAIKMGVNMADFLIKELGKGKS